MINENTLRILNDIGFGADIDSLESYILDFKYARLMSNMSLYEHNYLKMCKMLKELKPGSPVLTDKLVVQPSDLDNNDSLFSKYPNINTEVMYGFDANVLNNIKVNIDAEPDNAADIFAFTNVIGIDIKCTYMHGYLYRIDTIGENNKYIDITELVKDKMPYSISELSKYNLVELRGKLTIFNRHSNIIERSLNIQCSVIKCMRTKTNIECLSMVFNDLIIDSDDLPYNNQWEKISFMRELNILVPHHALIRNIDKDNIEQALAELDEYFEETDKQETFVYNYSGISIRFNNDIYCNTVGHFLIYNSRDCKSTDIFYSTVKSLSTTTKNKGLGQRINITEKKCNNNLIIKYIDINDIYDLEKYKVEVGKKVKFNIIEGKAILCK